MVNKCKHNKQIMIESSFEFKLSSKNKPTFIASGYEFFFKQKKSTENSIWRKYQTHKRQASVIAENNELVNRSGEHNYGISAGKSDAQNDQALKRSQRELYTDCRSCQSGFASDK